MQHQIHIPPPPRPHVLNPQATPFVPASVIHTPAPLPYYSGAACWGAACVGTAPDSVSVDPLVFVTQTKWTFSSAEAGFLKGASSNACMKKGNLSSRHKLLSASLKTRIFAGCSLDRLDGMGIRMVSLYSGFRLIYPLCQIV